MQYLAKGCSFYHTPTPTAAARNETNSGLITSIEEEEEEEEDGDAAGEVVKTAVITSDGAAKVCEVVGRCDRLCSDEC